MPGGVKGVHSGVRCRQEAFTKGQPSSLHSPVALLSHVVQACAGPWVKELGRTLGCTLAHIHTHSHIHMPCMQDLELPKGGYGTLASRHTRTHVHACRACRALSSPRVIIVHVHVRTHTYTHAVHAGP